MGRVLKRYQFRTKLILILVPAAVAATENVTGRACASSPLMFFGDSFPSTDVAVRSAAKASCQSDCLASASD